MLPFGLLGNYMPNDPQMVVFLFAQKFAQRCLGSDPQLPLAIEKAVHLRILMFRREDGPSCRQGGGPGESEDRAEHRKTGTSSVGSTPLSTNLHGSVFHHLFVDVCSKK